MKIRNFIYSIIMALLASACSTEDSVREVDSDMVTSYIAPCSEKYPRNTKASCIQLSNGTLFAVYTQFIEGTADDANARMVGIYSYDDGKSWNNAHIIVEDLGESNVMSASLVEHKGIVYLYFLAKNSDLEGNLDLDLYYILSENETKSWGQPVKINKTKGYWAVLNDAVLVTYANRILIPISYYAFDAMFTDKAQMIVLYSDNGTDYFVSNSLCVEDSNIGGTEPTLCELPTEDILMSIRTELGYQYFSISSDGGETFSKPYMSNLKSSNSPVKIIAHNGKLYAIHNPLEPQYRNRICISRSIDMGNTWKEIYVLQASNELGVSLAYPSAIVSKEKLLITYWEFNPGEVGYSLKFCSIPMNLLSVD